MIQMLSLLLQVVVIAGPSSGAKSTGDAVAMKLQDFPLCHVRLLEGRLQEEQERNRAYLHDLDADRLLYSFRKNAGLPAPGEPYGGWEAPACEVRGHFVGHFLSACALMYASTGDKALKAKADGIVSEFAKCQQALGGEYLSAFPESFFDRVETGQPVWVPYYTMHKIMAGLYDVRTLCGNAEALSVLESMASYFKKRVDKLPPDVLDRMLRVEFGGMSEVLHNLYALTRKPEHLALAHKFDQGEFLGPLAIEWDNLTRIHGNTQIPKVIGAARHYELTGDARYRDIAVFFWNQVVNGRTDATGGSTMFEAWPEPGKLADTLGHLNHETCKTHNMLKLTRHLLQWTGDVRYADFYERAFLNGILGTQGPRPGLLQYYVAMAPGYPRVFGTPDNSFWCCYGTGVESFSKLGDSIYFHDGKNLFVNLFAPSEVTWPEQGMRVEQRTRFPEEEGTTIVLHLRESKRFALNVRVPYWVAGTPEVSVNGRKQSGARAGVGAWMTVTRTWKDGDRIEIRLPMRLHTMALPDDPEQVAVLYGPVVLAGILDPRKGEDVCVHAVNDGIVLFERSARPVFFTGDPGKPEGWIQPVAGSPLHFQSIGTEPRITFVPFGGISVERYGLYWPVVATSPSRLKSGEDAASTLDVVATSPSRLKSGEDATSTLDVVARDSERHKALLEKAGRYAREIDRVFIFPREVDATCSERTHNLQGDKTSSGAVPSTAFVYRHAEPGGWFSWDLAVLPDQPMELPCTYWGGDTGRTFDVLARISHHL